MLTLQPSTGTADLNALFYGAKKEDKGDPAEPAPSTSKAANPKKHILCVNTYQMVILLLFNRKESYTFDEIKEETSIPQKELTRALQPITIGKSTQRILIKSPKSKEFEGSHVFTVNDGFTSQFHR